MPRISASDEYVTDTLNELDTTFVNEIQEGFEKESSATSTSSKEGPVALRYEEDMQPQDRNITHFCLKNT